jgi:hypothetical protein
MRTLRRASERKYVQGRQQEAWHTFHANGGTDALADGFGALERFDEDRLRPGAGLPAVRPNDAEIVTYVREGALAHEDSTGRSGVIDAGEFQRMTFGRGVRHSEANASRTDWVHFFQIGLRPSEVGLETCLEQKRFYEGDRRGALRVVASPDGHRGSLRIHQNASIYSALLDPGHHIAHELSPGRIAWLHVVRGAVSLGDVVLTTGDGAGVTADRVVSFTALEETEILLVDLVERPIERARTIPSK